jgi:hypothetical protein
MMDHNYRICDTQENNLNHGGDYFNGILGGTMTQLQAVGGVLILGLAFLSEIGERLIQRARVNNTF